MLRGAAVLSMCKLMCVSPQFCDEQLQLLFSVLATPAEDSALRANIAIALGDVAFRFPNLIEPWTTHMYRSLRDPDTRVRKHTLMCLTHLVLNDMIKVRGQISEIALCLEVKSKALSRGCVLYSGLAFGGSFIPWPWISPGHPLTLLH